MKASKVIAKLQALIEEHGDLEVGLADAVMSDKKVWPTVWPWVAVEFVFMPYSSDRKVKQECFVVKCIESEDAEND